MDEYYSVGGIVLRLSHGGDALFGALQSELRYFSGGRIEPDCTAILRPVSGGLSIPEKAVRTNVWEGKSVYSSEGRIHLLGESRSYLASIDYARKELLVDYREYGPELKKAARWLIKWLIIMSAQEKGLTYIHASAARFRGRNVIFCGDSNCGKSSSLLRLVSEGGRAISDDSVLYDGRRIIPFSMNTTMDSDFEKRFSIDSGSFQIGSHMDVSERYEGAPVVIFLRIWNSDASESRPLDYGRAILSLMGTYRKEIPFLWSNLEGKASSGRIFEKYSEFLKGASCYEFFAGRNEPEVKEKLLSLIS